MPGALALTVSPCWAFKPSLVIRYQSTYVQGSRQRPCWRSCEGRKAVACTGGLPWAEGSPPSQLPLALVEPICQPGAAIYHSVQFSCSVVSNSLWLHGMQHTGLPCPSPTPRAYSSSRPWASDAIQLSHPLSSPSPPAFTLSQHQGLFQWVSSSHQVIKVLEFHPQHQSSQWIFRTDSLYDGLVESPCSPRDSQDCGILQHHSSKALILQCSAFFIVQLSHPYMTTGKTIALTRRTFVGKVMSLLLNMLSRLDITFLPRRKHLSISWLQSPSAVILEQKKIKSLTVSIVSPSIYLEVMRPDAMILVFWMLSFKPTSSLSSFTFIKGLFSSSLLSALSVICISEVIDISPDNLDSSLCFFQPSISHDVLCI